MHGTRALRAVALGAALAIAVVPAKLAAAPHRRVPLRAAVTASVRPGAQATLDMRPGSRVELWGDSLAFEAKDDFTWEAAAGLPGGVQIETHTFGGTATCDWLDDIAQVARQPISAAVLE